MREMTVSRQKILSVSSPEGLGSWAHRTKLGNVSSQLSLLQLPVNIKLFVWTVALILGRVASGLPWNSLTHCWGSWMRAGHRTKHSGFAVKLPGHSLKHGGKRESGCRHVFTGPPVPYWKLGSCFQVRLAQIAHIWLVTWKCTEAYGKKIIYSQKQIFAKHTAN